MRIEPAALARAIGALDAVDLDRGLVPSVLQLATMTKQLLNVDGVGLMLVDAEGALRWAAASDQQAEQLEQAQEELAQGPCTDAFWQRAPVPVRDVTGEGAQQIAAALLDAMRRPRSSGCAASPGPGSGRWVRWAARCWPGCRCHPVPLRGPPRPGSLRSSPTSRRLACMSGWRRCTSSSVTATGHARSGSGPPRCGPGPSVRTAGLDRRPHRAPDALGSRVASPSDGSPGIARWSPRRVDSRRRGFAQRPVSRQSADRGGGCVTASGVGRSCE
jgi:hypothetical protein